MVLVAAFKTLLHRYTGADDVVIGAPISGRHHEELEPLIGFFSNTLVLRTDLSGDPTFGELVGRVKVSSLSAQAYQELPFEKLVEALNPERTTSYSPLFQVLLGFDVAPSAEPTLAGTTLEGCRATSSAVAADQARSASGEQVLRCGRRLPGPAQGRAPRTSWTRSSWLPFDGVVGRRIANQGRRSLPIDGGKITGPARH